nr:hypothetical protein [Pseudomonas benzenivorans]
MIAIEHNAQTRMFETLAELHCFAGGLHAIANMGVKGDLQVTAFANQQQTFKHAHVLFLHLVAGMQGQFDGATAFDGLEQTGQPRA